MSGQVGNVTRIASCETRQDSKRLLAWHKEKIVSTMSDRFSLHITIDYSQRIIPGLRFYYFNKPFGLLDFMEHVLGYKDTASSTANPNDDTIILLLDPDQLLIRPFINDFSPNSSEYWRPTRGNVTLRDKVSHGFPFAQQYGYGLQWKNKVNVTYVANGPTRITSMSVDEAWSHYAVGPPYIATARDMYAIARTWTQFVPRVLDLYPHLLAEMFAYSLAAAHLNMPHRVAQSFMVSDVKTTAEAWKLVHAMGRDNLCRETTTQSPEHHHHHHPHVLHYCHNYNLGEWFIGKYRLRNDFISCDAPLLEEPPPDLPQYDYQLAPDGSHVTLRNRQAVERQAYMICTLIPKLNQAARFFKEHHCHGQANYNAIHLTQT
jgi:peptidyl serine alpha-galactosyltransferase